MELIERINNILPQTQCGQCGYKGCRPYAEALARGTADINQCPPGGDSGIMALAKQLGVAFKPLNPAFGVHKPRQVAFIEEQDCIGCVKCINACPVDAIIGSAKFMHTVLADECTGCELCVEPCPVDCITMLAPTTPSTPEADKVRQTLSRRRYEARTQRIAEAELDKAEKRQKQKALLKARIDGIKKI
jgi:Na+-translocating ferredoxin:NAD+ oxidoreductase subunit B